MDISLITIHVGNNFGSVLQTIASARVLEKLGHKVTVVDYRPDRVTFKSYLRGALSSPVKFAWRMIYLPIYLQNKKIYGSYLKRHCKLSAPIYVKDCFGEKCPKADVYITGSDQVWNTVHNQGFDGRYFFEGVDGKKISYSSSIGRTQLDEEEKMLFVKALSDYDSLSVREDSGVRLLSEMGFSATQLIDPTLMLSKEDWIPFMSPRLIKNSYLLMYLPYNIKDKQIIIETAKKIAATRNLEIVTFSWSILKDKDADRTVRFADPGDFLSLFYHADYVITNSFHGTAFSINMEKDFTVFQPSAFSTRISSVLRLTDLTSRQLYGVISEEEISQIDFSKVRELLDEHRTKAIGFLQNALHGEEKDVP